MMRHSPALPLACGAIGLLLLAGCNSNEDAAAPAPTPSLTTQAMPSASAGGEPLTEGQWTIGETGSAATAEFGAAGAEPMVRLVCLRDNRQLTLVVVDGKAQEPKTYAIQVGAQRVGVRMEPTATGVAAMRAEIDPTQPIFAAFSDPAETIEIGAEGEATLRLPAHTGISRVVQACS